MHKQIITNVLINTDFALIKSHFLLNILCVLNAWTRKNEFLKFLWIIIASHFYWFTFIFICLDDDDDDDAASSSQPDGLQETIGAEKKAKGRTGWPQQVWALELNQWPPHPLKTLHLHPLLLDSNWARTRWKGVKDCGKRRERGAAGALSRSGARGSSCRQNPAPFPARPPTKEKKDVSASFPPLLVIKLQPRNAGKGSSDEEEISWSRDAAGVPADTGGCSTRVWLLFVAGSRWIYLRPPECPRGVTPSRGAAETRSFHAPTGFNPSACVWPQTCVLGVKLSMVPGINELF